MIEVAGEEKMKNGGKIQATDRAEHDIYTNSHEYTSLSSKLRNRTEQTKVVPLIF
jgi:hypothetical protein